MEKIIDKYLVKKYQNNENSNEGYYEKVEKIKNNQETQIELSKLVAFRKQQPFSMYSEEKKREVKKSIKRFGVLEPIIVREIGEDKYEIIAGHNRVECCRELGISTIKAIVMNVDDNTATLIMIETNLCTRDEILPIEKGRAYKLKLDILKKINADKENSQYWENGSINELSKEIEDSKSTIYRYISLTNLIPEFQNLVNNGSILLIAGSEIGALDKEKQEILYAVINDNNIKLRNVEMQKLKDVKEFNYQNVLDRLISKTEKKIKFTGKLNKNITKKYKDKFKSDVDFSKLIDDLLEKYFNENQDEYKYL